VGIPPQRLTAQTLRRTFGYANLNPLRGYVTQPILNLQQAVEAIVCIGRSGNTSSELTS